MTKAMECAEEVAKYLAKRELTTDTSIYVDGARFHVLEDGSLKKDIDCDVDQFIEYHGDFLTMSFEGPLYDALNYGYESEFYAHVSDELEAIFNKYGKYSEMGYEWSLSLYDL